MDTFAHFPTRLHWTAQQLTDAVPLRLHELYAFDAARGAACPGAANGERRTRPAANAYAVRSPLPARFGIG
ncbi:hypothetical protein [Luteimonas sp. SDU101]|uniref:hypothetical protein n=1 Tax=unclassified Luteimonas TaxID=2629088 RepID=UPI003EBF3626